MCFHWAMKRPFDLPAIIFITQIDSAPLAIVAQSGAFAISRLSRLEGLDPRARTYYWIEEGRDEIGRRAGRTPLLLARGHAKCDLATRSFLTPRRLVARDQLHGPYAHVCPSFAHCAPFAGAVLANGEGGLSVVNDQKADALPSAYVMPTNCRARACQ